MWFVLAFLISVVSTPGATGRVAPKAVELRADLDRDGVVDTAIVSFKPGGIDHYRVQIGQAVYDGLGEYLHGTATVVDIDTTDNSLEIAIPEWGPSDDDAVNFLRYAGGRIRLIGIVPAGAGWRIDGSGTIRTECRGRILCTWIYPCEYRWSEAAEVLAEVPRAFKPMKVEVTLRRDLPVCPEPLLLRSSMTLSAGTRATIDLTDDLRWCRIRTARRGSGWFSVEAGWVQLYPASVAVEEMFEGLPMAD